MTSWRLLARTRLDPRQSRVDDAFAIDRRLLRTLRFSTLCGLGVKSPWSAGYAMPRLRSSVWGSRDSCLPGIPPWPSPRRAVGLWRRAYVSGAAEGLKARRDRLPCHRQRKQPKALTQKEQLNRREHEERKGVQCLASTTTFTQGGNVVRTAISCFSLCHLRLCGSECRV